MVVLAFDSQNWHEKIAIKVPLITTSVQLLKKINLLAEAPHFSP